MCIVVSSICCGTITKGIKTPGHCQAWTLENHHNGRRSLPAAMCQTPENTNSATADVVALCCCRKVHIPPNCVAQTAEGGLFLRRSVFCVSLSPAHVRARLH
ncbi:hypothetical protein AVEN_169773-1 [Araneus ventricosus]|uniref:Uncharacterized protein n=1 Tax=Araneus ventricosus TaxID=182803 RepID=A0A4Y2HL71_ARAVE|nr:hypothetical protein AVEN_169773-1 [Araneus ventricosus]